MGTGFGAGFGLGGTTAFGGAGGGGFTAGGAGAKGAGRAPEPSDRRTRVDPSGVPARRSPIDRREPGISTTTAACTITATTRAPVHSTGPMRLSARKVGHQVDLLDADLLEGLEQGQEEAGRRPGIGP